MNKLILIILNWKLIVAIFIVGILSIINFQATNNLAGAFKSKGQKINILIINTIGFFLIFFLLLYRMYELSKLIS